MYTEPWRVDRLVRWRIITFEPIRFEQTGASAHQEFIIYANTAEDARHTFRTFLADLKLTKEVRFKVATTIPVIDTTIHDMQPSGRPPQKPL